LLVLVAGALAAVTSFGYLGGFLAPDADAQGLPIAVVNLDQGAEIGPTPTRFGDQVVDQLRAPNVTIGDSVAWQVAASRDEAIASVREDRAYAALVIPPDFSARLIAIATVGSTEAAAIEVLTNPASGSYSGAYSQAVATAAVDQVSRETARQLTDTLTGLGATLSPAVAATAGRPVETTVTIAHPIGERGGRGLAPFYFAVVIVVAALFATSTLNVAIDVAAGHQKLSVLGHPVTFGALPPADLGPVGVLRAKLKVAGPVAAAVGLTTTAIAVGPLDMTVDQPWLLAAFAVLGALAAAAITLALYAAFDLAGSVLAALFLVIYGVPASAGVYPVQAMPAFFRFLHSWLPLRYLSDGVRSIAFGGGPTGTIARSAAVLGAYALVGIAASFFAARHAAQRQIQEDQRRSSRGAAPDRQGPVELDDSRA
jgi:YhgE/Pip-like protein